MPATVKNIIFDFGNVLFDLDLERPGREIKHLVGEDADNVYRQLKQQGIFELYETGGLSTEEFIEAIRHAGRASLSAQQIIDAWNSIFLSMPAARFDLLLDLRRRYRVFLLSNINELHAAWIDEYMAREHGIADFQYRYFDGAYYSHLIRLRKPEPEIYEYVLADAELNPQESLFFDDLEENVQAARRLGIRAFRHDPATEIADTLDRVLNGQLLQAK